MFNFLLKATFFVRMFGIFQVPLIALVRPRVIRLDEEVCEIMIPFKRRVKNHLGSLYFGAFAIACDLAGGLLAMDQLKRKNIKASLAFKAFTAQFHKRAHGDVVFRCADGKKVAEIVEKISKNNERINQELIIEAYCKNEGPEPVGSFTITLSLKRI